MLMPLIVRVFEESSSPAKTVFCADAVTLTFDKRSNSPLKYSAIDAADTVLEFARVSAPSAIDPSTKPLLSAFESAGS